jgi:hypothetical protein
MSTGAQRQRPQTSGPRRTGAPQQRFRQVDRSERKQTEVEDIVSKGVAHFKVSAATPRTAYCHLARLFLAGYDNQGNHLEGTNKVNSVQFTALGTAITSVIYVADNLVKGGVASYAGTETEYLDGEDKDVSRRSGPRIVITLKKNPSWNYKNDETLRKSKIYRKYVLKENVEVDDDHHE